MILQCQLNLQQLSIRPQTRQKKKRKRIAYTNAGKKYSNKRRKFTSKKAIARIKGAYTAKALEKIATLKTKISFSSKIGARRYNELGISKEDLDLVVPTGFKGAYTVKDLKTISKLTEKKIPFDYESIKFVEYDEYKKVEKDAIRYLQVPKQGVKGRLEYEERRFILNLAVKYHKMVKYRYDIITKYFNIKFKTRKRSSSQIRDHIRKQRLYIQKSDLTHPYVRYYAPCVSDGYGLPINKRKYEHGSILQDNGKYYRLQKSNTTFFNSFICFSCSSIIIC